MFQDFEGKHSNTDHMQKYNPCLVKEIHNLLFKHSHSGAAGLLSMDQVIH